MSNNRLQVKTAIYFLLFAAAASFGGTVYGQGACPAVGLPIVENFDTPDSLPTCWERDENFDNAAMKAHIVGSPVFSGIGALMISSGADNDVVHEAYVMGRRLTSSPAGIRLKMKVRANQAGAVLMVGACESDSYFVLEYGFQAVDTLTIATPNTWIDYEVDFAGYTGTGDRLAFRMRQAMQGGQIGNEIYIDEMTVERCAVDNLWVSHRSSDELTLHWDSFGLGTANLTVTPASGGTPLTFDSVSSPFRITGLTPSTTYTLTLTPECTGETIDGLPRSISAATLAGPHDGLVYCEGFEQADMATGWIMTGSAAAVTLRSYTGTRSLYLPQGLGYAAMPQIAHNGGTLAMIDSLMFDIKLYSTTSSSLLQIGLTNYPEEDTTIVPIDTIQPSLSGAWNAITQRLSAHGATGRYIILRTLGGGDIYIDDLRVGRCLLTGVALAGKTATSITIEWDTPDDNGDVTIEPILGGGSTITVTESQSTTVGGKKRYTIDGLTPGSSHSYAVYGSCDPGHCGAATVSTTTYAQDYTIPYCTDFEVSGTLPTDWQNVSTHNGRPQIGTGNRHSGSRALELSAAGGITSQHSTVMLPPLSTGAADSVTISFAALSQTSGGTIEVGTLAENGDESTFVASSSCTPTEQWERFALRVGTSAGQRLAMRYYHNGYGTRTAWIDDLEVNLAGVSSIYASGERATGATITWSGGGDTVDIELRRSGSIWTERHNDATSPLVLDSLDEGATYNFYVRCRTAAGEGCWMYAGSFTTNSDALRADYCHPVTFSVGTTIWTLPFLEESSYTNLRVTLEAMGSGTVQIGLMTDEGNASTFTQIGSGAAGSGNWNRIIASLTGHENLGHYIALRCTGNAQVRRLRIAHGDITQSTVSAIGATQATVSWSADGEVDSVLLILTSGGNVAFDTTLPYPATTSITLEGLDASTNYSYTLTAIHDSSDRSCANLDGTFTTLGSDIAAGWCETFDPYSYGTLPIGWTSVAGNGSDPAVYYYNGSQRLRFSSNSQTSAMLALPIALSAVNTLQLRTEAIVTGSYTAGAMLVAGIMTNPSDASTFTPLDTVYPTTTSRTFALDLRDYNGNGRAIALRYISPAGSSTLYLDNMGLNADQVAELTVDRITDHSVRLRWQSTGAVHIVGGGIDTVVANTNELIVDGLSSNTEYNFTANVAGSDSTSACLIVGISAHTLIAPAIPPLCLSLDDYNASNQLPYGWTRPYGNYPQSYTGTRYEGSRSLRFYTAGGSTMVVSPMIETQSLGSLYLSFYLYNTSSSATFEAGVMIDPTDTSTFIPLQSFGYASGWNRCELSLAGAPDGAQYIAFRHNVTSSWSQTAYLDYIMLIECPMPTASITNPRTNTLDVIWNYPQGVGDSVVIEWGGNHSVHTAVSPYTITGLTSSTNYTVTVRPLCAEDIGCHHLTLNQTTLPEPSDMPYCQGFDSYSMPSEWHTWSDSGSVNLTTVTPSGTRALRMFAYAGASVTAIMPQISTAGYCDTLDSIYINLRISTSDIVSDGSVLQIGIVEDLLVNGSFTTISNIQLGGINGETWRLYTMSLPPESLVPGFLALRLVAPSGSSTTITVDDICIGYCFATDIHIIDISPTSTTFEWTGHGAASVTIQWSGGTYTAYNSPFTIEGFQPNQSYSFGFTANCQCGYGRSYGYNFTPRMPAEPMVLPVCYAFNDMSIGSFPNNWRRTGGAYSSYPRIATAGGESHAMDLYTNGSWPLTMAMEPLPDSSGDVVVSLRAWCNNAECADTGRMVLGLMVDPENQYTFTPLQHIVLNATETWQTFHFTVPASTYRYIAFRFTPSTAYHYYLDDISVASCAVGNITTDDDTVNITLLGSATGALIEIENNAGQTRTIGPIAAGIHSAASFGLASDSTYTLRAYALCGDTIGCVEEKTIVGQRHELPLCEDFSTSGLHPYGWEAIQRSGPVYPRIENGSYHLQPSASTSNIVVLPLLPLGETIGGKHVRLTVRYNYNSDFYYAYLELGTIIGGAFVSLAELHNNSTTQTHYVTLPSSAGKRLALRARSTSGIINIYIDDLQITSYPEPPVYTLTQTGYRQQHIYWSDTNAASHYSIEYGPYGFIPGSGDTVASDSCHAVLSPLTPSTRYQFYFIDTIGNRFCYPHEFTSMAPATEIPYCFVGNTNLEPGRLNILPESSDNLQRLTFILTWECGQGGFLEVGAMSDIADASTFAPLDTLTPNSPGVWQRDSVSLAGYTDTGHFVAIRTQNAWGVVTLMTLQSVPQPHFHVLNSSTIEATQTGDSIDYYLYVCQHGQPQSVGTLHHVTTSPYLITNLSMYTQYDIYTSADNNYTCAPPVTFRTHLDITIPHCTDLGGSLPAGWYSQGPYRVMPYPIIDSIARLHLYLNGNDSVTIGATSALDDTASFVPLQTIILSASDSHIYLAPYADSIGERHYIAFRLEKTTSAIGALNVQTIARPSYHVLSSSTIEATLPDSLDADYYIEACLAGQPQGSGTIFHATSSPYILQGLTMYTWYDLYARADSAATTCDAPVTLRTHLDIEPPYCNLEGSDGWHTAGSFHVMPYAVVDTMISLYATFTSQGPITIGVQPTLTDTTLFVPLADFQNSTLEEHIIHLADYADLVGERHYLSFRYTGSTSVVTQVYLHTCPVPNATLYAFDVVRFEQDSAGIDYWIAYDDTVVYADTNPYFIRNLSQNTQYQFSIRCDSATVTCIPPIEIRTGVQISTPHCADLEGHRFTVDNLPDGWFTLDGGQYIITPIIDINSVSRIFMRLRYRLSQIGTAMAVGVMTSPYDASTFTTMLTLTDVGPTINSIDFSFADYTDTGRYLAFHAIGSNPQSAIVDRLEIQTVPFVNYLVTSWDSVLVVPTLGTSYGGTCFISYGDTLIAADSLPWGIGSLPPDSQLLFNIQASDSVAPCIAPTPVATTHLAATPLCGLSADLTSATPLWRGPELAEADISNLMFRATITYASTNTRIAIGTLRLRNVDSTFRAVDTINLSTGSVITSDFSAYNADGHFLAILLLEGEASLAGITLDHCLTPLGASLALQRHNVVRLYGGDTPGNGSLWLHYGPTGGTQTTIHIDTLPCDFTLANNTNYTFTLACDSSSTNPDTVSCAIPLTITTQAPPPPLSWCVPFDAVAIGQLPSDWRMATSLNAAQQVAVSTTYSHTSGRSLAMHSTIGHNCVVVLPDLGLDSLNGLSLSLWMLTDNTTLGVLEVGVIFNTSDPETFRPLRSLTCRAIGSWERHLVDLSDAPEGAYFLALRCKGVSGTNNVWLDDLYVSECGANSLEVTQVEANQITLRWRQTGTPSLTLDVIPDSGSAYTIDLSNITTSYSDEPAYRYATITNLSPLTNYQFAFSALCGGNGFCTTNYSDTCNVFTPAGGIGCIDPTNLTASYTTCFYGTYGDPVADTGSIDYGYASSLSRHTVHYDLTETDPRTGGLLHTVPDGAAASVRLGNWSHNATAPEAEAISYGLTVDTMEFNLLIMRYAAVLQDPNHSQDKQPRFSLELLDATGHVLDSSCGRADFIANYQLGWHPAANQVLWKDWTTVGVDLTPYAGQTVYVRLTTRDCNEGSHYGYAYFTLECMRRNVTTSSCGVVDNNQFTAPSGFNYYWYTSSSPDTISTAQTISVPTDNTMSYICQVSFVDNPGCYFTMNAYAGTRYPLSLFDYEVSLAPCSFDVVFTNHSTISPDGVTPAGTGEGVETAVWILGNGDTVTAYNTSVNYTAAGTYNVSLITGIAGDACLDTLTIPLTLAFPETGMEISGPTERCWNAAADTLWLPNVVQMLNSSHTWTLDDSTMVGTVVQKRYYLVVDSSNYAAGSYTFTVEALDSVGCSISLSHPLTVHPTYRIHDTLHLCSLLLPYSWRDTTMTSADLTPPSSTSDHRIHRLTSEGCDSVMYLNLTLYNNADFTPRDTAYDAICDNQTFYFSDSLLTPDATLTHNIGTGTLTYTDSLYSSIGCDSLSTIVLTVRPTYNHHLWDTICSNHLYTWGTPQRTMLPADSTIASMHGSDTLAAIASIYPSDTSFLDSLTTIHSCDSLSSLHLHLMPSYSLHYHDTICDAHIASFGDDSLASWTHHYYHFEQTDYDSTGTYRHPLSTGSCDSVRTLHLKVYPTYDLHFYDTIYDGDLYTFESDLYDTTGVYPHQLPAVFSCDSLRTLHLQRNRRTYIDTVLCQNHLPYTWNNITFDNGGGYSNGGGMQVMVDSVHLNGLDGIDSLVVMTVVVRDTSATVDMVHSCDSLIWTHTPDTTYRTTTAQPYRYLTQLAPFDTTNLSSFHRGGNYLPFTVHLAPFAVQCDSVRHLDLIIDYTHYTTDYRIACDSIRWPDAAGHLTTPRYYYRDTLGIAGQLGSYNVNGPVDTMVTVGGCDSVVALDLNVHYATYHCDIDTFCWNEYYFWRTQFAGDTTSGHWVTTDHYYLTDTLQTHRFHHRVSPAVSITCDSVRAIRLTQMARPELRLTDSINCERELYIFGIETNVPYLQWTDNRTPLFTNDSIIEVAPAENTIYRAYVDYHRSPLCPLRDSISVRPVVVPEAVLKVNPEALRYDALEFDAYDLSTIAPRSIHPSDADIWVRGWYINQLLQDETDWQLHHLATPDRDTLELALRVFNGQCADTAIRLLPINRVTLFAPNVFTPLRDNNQRFMIVGHGIREAELFIYNREGLLVYRTTATAPDGNIEIGWDGRRSDGTLCIQANYVWKLIYHTIDKLQGEQSEVGNVLLIR